MTGAGFAGVSTYASNIQYRAWGGQKSVSYGDNSSATTNYNGRMQPSAYQLTTVPSSTFKLREEFQYYADGRLQKMTDLDDRDPDVGYPDTARYFSRAYRFDQVGRLIAAKGVKPSGQDWSLPFNQSYGYDAFSNMTYRSGTYYYQSYSDEGGTFQNNRRQDFTYAADGQVTYTPSYSYVGGPMILFRNWTYDAAGQMIQVKETVTATSSVSTYLTSYDGDGRQVREYQQENPVYSNSYLVRSTVLRGKTVTRLNNAGDKVKTTVNVDDRLVAVQHHSSGYDFVTWAHTDPLGLSEAGDTKSVYDPMGNYIIWQQVPTGPPPSMYPRSSSSFAGSGSSFGSAQDKSCVFNDRPISCTDLAHQIDIGNVSAVPSLHGGRRSIERPILPLGLGMSYVDGRDLPGDSGGYRGSERGEDGKDYEIIDGNTNSTRGAFVLFLQSPQNPVPLTTDQLGAIRNQIAALLNDKCANFINQIVSGRTGNPYDSKKQLLTDFNSVAGGKGGVFFGGNREGGDARGTIAAGNAEIRIDTTRHFTDPKMAFGAAFVALHELIHVIAGNDIQLSEQVNKLGITVVAYPGKTVAYPTDTDNKNLQYSGYWGQALKNACDPKGY